MHARPSASHRSPETPPSRSSSLPESVEPRRRRLFVAIQLDETTRRRLVRIAELLRAHGLDARYEPPEKFHITVAFLGAVESTRIESVVSAMREVARAHAAFTLVLDAVGGFPSMRRARIGWVGPSGKAKAYRALALDLRAALLAAGFDVEEREPRSHVTLCRMPRPIPVPPLPIPPANVTVDALALVESLPSAGTTRYEELERTMLGG